MRVLIAEDHPANREMLQRRLERRGYEVCAVENGEQAVAQAQVLKPDVILMDLAMPVMSGVEATRALRAQTTTRDIKVIALTAHALESARRECLEAGCDAFVTKPLDFAKLLGTLEAVVFCPTQRQA